MAETGTRGGVALFVVGVGSAVVFSVGAVAAFAPDEAGGRCDLGLNTAAYEAAAPLVGTIEHHADHGHDRVDFTVDEWAATFTDPALGVPAGAVAAAVRADPGIEDSVLSGSLTTTLDPDPWVPVTDRGACDRLAAELDRSRAAAARYPTVADAEAAGYRQSSRYAPGQGAHYTKLDAIDRTFDPDEPELLMYTGEAPGDAIVGVSYFLVAPEGLSAGPASDVGFTGPNDRWHRHASLCQDDEGVAVAESECDAGRATVVPDRGGWMAHAWVVPGCESDWGVFSGANPRVKVLPLPDSTLGPGCGNGGG